MSAIAAGIGRGIGRRGLPLLLLLSVPGPWTEASTGATPLTQAEARILLYVSPAGQRLRDRGLDIAMELQTSEKLNQADYYYFWVYDSKKRSNGSVTVGYYAVNKHTADLWDTETKARISSELVSGVQRIVRESHHIDQTTIAEYRKRRF